MDDDDEQAVSMSVDIDICMALIERHAAIKKDRWKIRATLELFLEMLRMEAEQCDDEDHLRWSSNSVTNILTALLYVDKMPTQDEIEHDVQKFREILGRIDPEEN